MPADPIRHSRRHRDHGTTQPIEPLILIMIAKFFKINWKTTAAGLGAIGAAVTGMAQVLSDGLQMSDVQPLTLAVGMLCGGIAAIFARDADKSTEDTEKG